MVFDGPHCRHQQIYTMSGWKFYEIYHVSYPTQNIASRNQQSFKSMSSLLMLLKKSCVTLSTICNCNTIKNCRNEFSYSDSYIRL